MAVYPVDFFAHWGRYRTMSVAVPFMPEMSTIERIALGQIRGAPLKAGLAYWMQLRGERPYPARDDLKMRDMTGVLPYMSLVRVIDGGADFEHRIVGDVMVRAFSVPIQQRRFSDIAWDAPELIEASFPLFREVVTARAPVAWRQQTGKDASHATFTDSEVVLMPLGSGAVDHVLGFGVHESRLARSGRPPVRPTA